MQNSEWDKHSSKTSSYFPMTPKKPQQWLQVVGHAGLFLKSHFSQKVLHLFVLYASEKSKRQKLQHIATKKIIYCANFIFREWNSD